MSLNVAQMLSTLNKEYEVAARKLIIFYILWGEFDFMK